MCSSSADKNNYFRNSQQKAPKAPPGLLLETESFLRAFPITMNIAPVVADIPFVLASISAVRVQIFFIFADIAIVSPQIATIIFQIALIVVDVFLFFGGVSSIT